MPALKLTISHQSDEKELAHAWQKLLGNVSGDAITCWFSTDGRPSGGMSIGKEWRDQIYQELDSSAAVIAIQTPFSSGRPWVMWECGAASGLRKERGIIPVVYSMDQGRLTGPLASYEVYRGTHREDVKNVCAQLMQQAGLALRDEVFDLFYKTYLEDIQRLPAPPSTLSTMALGVGNGDAIVKGWLEAICRALSVPDSPERLTINAFVFRREDQELVRQYLWCHRPRAEETSLTRFALDAQTATRVVVVRCFLENRVGGADFKIAGDRVQPLPSDFKGVKGEITPDLGYVLAAPIRRKDEVWGVIDLDAASDDGTRILKQAAAQDVLCCVAKNLSNLLAP